MSDQIRITLDADDKASPKIKEVTKVVSNLGDVIAKQKAATEAAAAAQRQASAVVQAAIAAEEKAIERKLRAEQNLAAYTSRLSAQTAAQKQQLNARVEADTARHEQRMVEITMRGVLERQRLYDKLYVQQQLMLAKQEAAAARAASSNQTIQSLLMGIGGSAGMAITGGAGAALVGGLFAKEVFKEGMEFNSLMETSRLGIAAMLMTVRQFKDEQGKLVDGTKAYNLALGEAENVQRLLRNEAFRTLGTMEEMIVMYQRLQAGAGSSKATSEEIVRLVGSISNFAKATGTDMDELAAQVNLALMGISRTTGKFGAFLRSQGITNEMLRQWQQSGESVKNLIKLFEKFEQMGPALNKTMAGVKSNLQDIKEQTAGAFTEPFYEAFRNAGQKAVEAFTEGVGREQHLKDSVRNTASALGQTIVTSYQVWFAGLGKVVADTLPWLKLFQKTGQDTAVTVGKAFINLTSVMATVVASFAYVFSYIPRMFLTVLVTGLELVLGKVIDVVNQAATIAQNLSSVIGKEPGDKLRELAIGIVNFRENLGALKSDPNLLKGLKDIVRGIGEEADKGKAALDKLMQPVGGGPSSSGSPPPKTVDVSKLKEQLTLWEAELDKFYARMGLGGKEGLAREIAQIKANAAQYEAELERAFKKAISGVKDKNVISILEEERDKAKAAGGEFMADELGRLYAKNERETRAWEAKLVGIVKDSEEAKILARSASQREQLSQYVEFHRQRVEAGVEGAEMELETARKVARTEEDIARQEFLALSAIDAKKRGDYAAYQEFLILEAVAGGKGIVEATRQAAKDVAQLWYDSAYTVEQGLSAGWKKVIAETKTTGQVVADAVTDMWNAISSGLEGGIFNLITGKAESMRDLLLGVWSDIAKSFSKMVSTMVRDWIVGQIQMKFFKERESPGGIPGLQGGIPLQGGEVPTDLFGVKGLSSSLMGAGLGFGLGMAVGGGNPIAGVGGAIMGASLAALMAGAVIPIIGWIGAAVGGIIMGIGALLRKNTEKSEKLSGPDIGPGGNASAVEAWNVYGSTIGSFADIMRAGGGSGSSIANAIRAGNDEFLRSTNVRVHAGSSEDMAKDWDQYFKTHLPRTLLSIAFGQEANGKFKNLAGIEGVPDFYQGTYSKDSPIVKLLDTLGFTDAKIKDIASQIDTRDPEDFLKWLEKLVGVVKGFNDLITDYKKISTVQGAFDAVDAKNQTPAEKFKQSAKDLIDQMGDLSFLAGDEQLDRAKDIEDALRKRYDEELKFIEEVKKQIESFSKQIEDDITSMHKSLMTKAQYEDDLRTRTAIPDFTGMTDPAKVIDAANKARTATIELFGILVDRLETLRDLGKEFDTLSAAFLNHSGFSSSPATPNSFAGGVAAFQQSIADAYKLSGQEQVEAITNIRDAARQRYEEEKQMLSAIQSAIESITQGINQDIFDANLSLKNPQDQATTLYDEIQRLYGEMFRAQSPEEVQNIVNQIRTYARQYLGLFSADDPNRAAAVEFYNRILTQTRDDSTALLETMRQKVTNAGDLYAQALKDAGDLVKATITDIDGQLDALEANLRTLNTQVDTTLRGIVQEVIDTNKDLEAAMNAAKLNFTGMKEKTDPLVAEDGSLTRLERNANRAAAALGDLADLLENRTKNVRAGGDGTTSAVVTPNYVSNAIADNNAALVRYFQSNPAALNPGYAV